MIAESDWVPALARKLRGTVTVMGTAPLAGGYATAGVRRVDLLVDGRERSVVVKPAGAAEIAALRAVTVVPGVDAPTVLAAGDGWVVLPLYTGDPDLPAALASLRRVHAHWRGKRPRGVPVADGVWWRALCARIRPALDAAAHRTGEAVFADVAAALDGWAADPRAHAAAAALSRTLVHGDPHRGNLVAGVLVDWGNALVAPAAFDLVVLRAEGTAVDIPPAELAWAELAVPVRYLGFAADHLGAARVAELAGLASRGYAALPA